VPDKLISTPKKEKRKKDKLISKNPYLHSIFKIGVQSSLGLGLAI
jgi:hypothetical protein